MGLDLEKLAELYQAGDMNAVAAAASEQLGVGVSVADLEAAINASPTPSAIDGMTYMDLSSEQTADVINGASVSGKFVPPRASVDMGVQAEILQDSGFIPSSPAAAPHFGKGKGKFKPVSIFDRGDVSSSPEPKKDKEKEKGKNVDLRLRAYDPKDLDELKDVVLDADDGFAEPLMWFLNYQAGKPDVVLGQLPIDGRDEDDGIHYMSGVFTGPDTNLFRVFSVMRMPNTNWFCTRVTSLGDGEFRMEAAYGDTMYKAMHQSEVQPLRTIAKLCRGNKWREVLPNSASRGIPPHDMFILMFTQVLKELVKHVAQHMQETTINVSAVTDADNVDKARWIEPFKAMSSEGFYDDDDPTKYTIVLKVEA